MSDLERKDVPDEIVDKVLRFALEKKTFTTKELFERYPNNPEHYLRYALNNLRIDKKLLMIGNKRGAYYTTDLNATESNDTPGESNNSDLKSRILEATTKLTGWFSRPKLGIEDVSVPTMLEAIRELIDEGKLQSRGERRWTEYALSGVVNIEEVVTNQSVYDTILSYIKKNKVVTIPLLINELEIQRSEIVPVLDKLCSEEEIWHEGIKKSSKYIYKDVDINDMEKYLDKLNDERKLDQRIDALSGFLINDFDDACVIIGANKDGDFEIKHVDNTRIVKREKFENINDCLNSLKKLTVAI